MKLSPLLIALSMIGGTSFLTGEDNKAFVSGLSSPAEEVNETPQPDEKTNSQNVEENSNDQQSEDTVADQQ